MTGEVNIVEEIKGVVADIVYQNSENGYAVVDIVTDTGMMITAVGIIPMVSEGRMYIFRGHYTEHEIYGEQFSISSYEEKMPDDVRSIKLFLESEVIKGVGPVLAEQIVDRFGEETLEIIEHYPERLCEIPGIGPGKMKAIEESYRNHRGFRDVAMFFQKYDIAPHTAMAIYKIFGKNTVDAVKENPYILIGEISGIGFKKADAIAEKMGVSRDNEHRLVSGVVHILTVYSRSGHSFCPRKKLAEEAAAMLDVSVEEADEAVISAAFSGAVQVEILEGREVVYLYGYYRAEKYITGKLVALNTAEKKLLSMKADDMIRQTEQDMGVDFSEEQKKAILSCLDNGVSVITGGPGTGKTTIINGIINVFEGGGLSVAICAPTGRAAKRISETSGHDASTVHRLLEYHIDQTAGSMKFGRNEENQLEQDVVIVDEASMVDLMLAEALLKAMKPGMRLVFVGDADQLPSVGTGNVLRDIIKSEYIYCESLTEIFRQARESMIVVNAHRINRGESPYCNTEGGDFFFMKRKREKDVLNLIIELCSRRLVDYYNFSDRMQDIQVLTPMRKGVLGTENLNRELQKVLNPPLPGLAEKKYGDRIFRVNDKVMQIKNNYDIKWICSWNMEEGEGIFNGDVGYIKAISTEDSSMTVVFDGERYVEYDFGQLEELELAYAITVHKSQGSEFPAVVIPIMWTPPALSGRNLLYTGITRGKKVVVLAGEQRYMDSMIANNSVKDRYSGLAIRLKEFLE